MSSNEIGNDFQASLLVGAIGDSGKVGFGTGDSADTGFVVGTPLAGCKYNRRYAVAVGPPPTLIDYPSALSLGSLSLYDIPGNQSMGAEMSLGPALLTAATRPAIIEYAITGSTLAVEWLTTGSYPAAGTGRLYNLMVAQFHALEAQCSRLLDVLIIELGTNDAANAGQAAAFQANMSALITQARIDFPGVKIVLVRPNPNVPNPNIATVITAINNIVAGDPTIKMVETDDLPLSGSFHATSNGYLSQGQREAFATLDTLGYARQSVATTPDVILYGPEVHGTGNLTVIPPAGERDGDLELMVVTIGIVAGSITTPAGWTLVSASGQATAIGVFENSSVFSRPVTTALLNANNGHMPAAAVTVVTSTRNAGKIFCVRGPNLNPTVGAVAPTANNAITTGPVSVAGVTTTANNSLVLCFSGGYCGSSGTMVVTNGGLTAVREVQDSACVIVTDRQIINVTIGTKATIGATGAWSATSSANTILVANTVEIKP